MWSVLNPGDPNIKMAENDYGIQLPIVLKGLTFGAADTVRVTIKNKINGTDIIEKEYTNVQNNTINFELTEADSALLPKGTYIYRIDWYKNDVFMCNLVPYAELKVVDKA